MTTGNVGFWLFERLFQLKPALLAASLLCKEKYHQQLEYESANFYTK